MSRKVVAEISETPISIQRAIEIVTETEGGLAVFAGMVRNATDDKDVSSLDYEAYDEVALVQTRQIAQTASDNHDAHVLIMHRTGRLLPGEISVLVAASTAHRAAAFDACEWCIDTLKERVAIWKKENFVSGESAWVNHP